MNNAWQRNLGILLAQMLVVAVLTGYLKTNFSNQRQNPVNASIIKSEETVAHPYGNPVNGPLMWEQSENFRTELARCKASVRMAAFQTTLPNPLPGEEYNVALAADMLSGTIILPNQIFSMNSKLGPYSKRKGFREGPAYFGTLVIETTGGGVCKIATTLYNVAVLSNLKTVERHSHGMLVPYVPPGQDATVSDSGKDIKFKNIYNFPILIWADTKDNSLYIAMYGQKTPPKVVWHHRILGRQPNRTIYRINSKLAPGAHRIVLDGAEGLSVRSWLTITAEDGQSVTRELGYDYYKPMPRIIERAVPPKKR